MNAIKTALPANLLRLGAGAVGLAAVGVFLIQGSEAAFTANVASESNSVQSGTVALANDGAKTAVFNVGNLNGGQEVTRCVNVTYTGSLTADIKLLVSADGKLAEEMATTIQVGTGAVGGPNFECGPKFTPGRATFTGTLAYFGSSHSTYATGIGGFDEATKGQTRSYKVTMKVPEAKEYMGASATVGFTWEAQGKDTLPTNAPAPTAVAP